MNVAEKKYSVFKQETVSIIFALKNFKLYLFPTERRTLITDQRAVKDAFSKKIHIVALLSRMNLLLHTNSKCRSKGKIKIWL